MKTKRLRDNALIIDYLDLKQNGTVRSAQYFMDANFDVFRIAGFKDGTRGSGLSSLNRIS